MKGTLWALIFTCSQVMLAAQDQFDPDNHPNIILIVADDMAVGDLSNFNGGKTNTPTLSSLITEGISFDKAYSASAVCAPARAALLTGLYPHRTGVVTLNMNRFQDLTSLYKSKSTLANFYHSNGYATGLVGKWHLGSGKEYHPLKRGFQKFVGFKDADVNSYFDYDLDIDGTYHHLNGEYLTDVLTRYAIEFVQQNKDGPFFLNLAYYSPHRPLGAPKNLVRYYEDRGYDRNTATIYAMIEVMDKGIGDLLEELDKLGIRENTLVIFTSDNGPDPLTGNRFNCDLRGNKYTIYEGGIRVPLIVAWKNKVTPTVENTVVHFTDIVPTLIELCHLRVSDTLHFDGGSFAKILLRQGQPDLPQVRFWQWNRGVPYYSHNAAMLKGDWKLVRLFVTRALPEGESNATPVLYNLKWDPNENKDYASEYPEEYATMKVWLEDWCRQMEFERLKR